MSFAADELQCTVLRSQVETLTCVAETVKMAAAVELGDIGPALLETNAWARDSMPAGTRGVDLQRGSRPRHQLPIALARHRLLITPGP